MLHPGGPGMKHGTRRPSEPGCVNPVDAQGHRPCERRVYAASTGPTSRWNRELARARRIPITCPRPHTYTMTPMTHRSAYTNSPPLLLPRGLILLACVWLIGSWLLSIGVRPPVEPSSASYTPGVRLMLVYIGIGLTIAWPLLRLSQSAVQRPIVQTVLDLIVLLSLIQVVIWPLRLVTPWTLSRTAALDATLVGWTALVGAIIASAVGSRRAGVRNLAITACLAMCLAGPAVVVVAALAGRSAAQMMNIGPLTGVYDLARGANAPVTATQWMVIGMPALAASVAWIALSVFYAAHRKLPTVPNSNAHVQ